MTCSPNTSQARQSSQETAKGRINRAATAGAAAAGGGVLLLPWRSVTWLFPAVKTEVLNTLFRAVTLLHGDLRIDHRPRVYLAKIYPSSDDVWSESELASIAEDAAVERRTTRRLARTGRSVDHAVQVDPAHRLSQRDRHVISPAWCDEGDVLHVDGGRARATPATASTTSTASSWGGRVSATTKKAHSRNQNN